MELKARSILSLVKENKVFLKGEIIRDEAGRIKIGDGVTAYNDLPYLKYMGQGLGCLKPVYDPRDYQFSDLLPSGAKKESFPKELVPDYHISFFDQGSTSMCCACAVAMSRYIYELNDSGNHSQFSPMYIYGNRTMSVVQDGVYEGEGMYLKDALKQLINAGDCMYDTLPGYGNYDTCKSVYEIYKDRADIEAKPFRISSYYAVKTASEIMKAVMISGSVLASFLVTSGWYFTGSNGIIQTFGSIEGGHAVLIVGWKIIEDKLYWIILNSWGEEWGDHGFGYIESNELNFMMEAYCILDEVHELDLKSKVNESENEASISK